MRDHRALVLSTRLGWRACGSGERKQLDAFLLARALEHDAPGVLLQLACDWLRHERIMRTSADTLSSPGCSCPRRGEGGDVSPAGPAAGPAALGQVGRPCWTSMMNWE